MDDGLPYDSTKVCAECEIFWGKSIDITKKKRQFKNREYGSWRNPDGTSHNVNCGTDEEPHWIHVWSKEEHELAKNGGTSALRPKREEQGFPYGQRLPSKEEIANLFDSSELVSKDLLLD